MADEIVEEEVLEEETEEVEELAPDEPEETEEDTTDDDEEEPDQPEFQKRFTQLKGDTPDEYIKNLEEAYAESGKEAVKLAREVRELKTPDKEETKVESVETNPAILWAQSQMQQTWQKEWDTFTQDHPEVNEKDPSYDAKLADDLNEQLIIVRDVILKKENRQVGMSEGLTKAWRLLDMEDNSKERVAMAAKDVAGQGRASSSKTKEAKPKFSDAQIAVAMDMMNVDRQEAIKRMSAYN